MPKHGTFCRAPEVRAALHNSIKLLRVKLKDQMRQHFRDARNQLSDQEVQLRSSRIAQRLPAILGPLESGVLCYVSRGHEVNTHGLIAQFIAADVSVYVPVMSDGAMRWTQLERFADLDLTTFEPKSGSAKILAPPSDAPVLVPGVVFTPEGARLGQGGGHFDRFLAEHRGLSVGLAFATQITDDVPEEPHDQRVDFVVSESAAYAAAPKASEPQTEA